MSDADKVLARVRAFLAKANDENNHEAERELAREQANKLMARHAISQAILDMTRPESERRAVANEKFALYDDDRVEYLEQIVQIMHSLCAANRVKVAYYGGMRSVHLVGMQEDIDWVKQLWMEILLQFVSKIRPTWDAKQPVVDNIYNFKNAGYKWKDIWDEGYRVLGAMPDGGHFFVPNKCSYMINGYRRLCKTRGTLPVGTQKFDAYRHSFTEAYKVNLVARVEAMVNATNEEKGEVVGSELALRDVETRVEDEFYRLFPNMRPKTWTAEERDAYYEELEREQAELRRKDAEYLAGLSPAVRRKVLAERAAQERRQARQDAKYWRDQDKLNARLTDVAGYAAGRRAAQEVNVRRQGRATEASKQDALEG